MKFIGWIYYKLFWIVHNTSFNALNFLESLARLYRFLSRF